MSTIVFKDLVKAFAGVKAVDRLNLTIGEGEFVTLLGPSGCGKTTTLRCLSGLEDPDQGEILVDDHCVFSSARRINLAPGQRSLGLVFQNYALWPHMKVCQNIAFGLRKANLDRGELARRVSSILTTVGLTGLEDRYPHELSGGQQQRVAVARMVVTKPRIFLFDEPLSNLDAKLRMKLRSELKRLHLDLKATTLYVTHDQVEAMALSDRIVVMKDGRIQQAGTPHDVYHFPANLFVADFMGNPQTNFMDAVAAAESGGSQGEARAVITGQDGLQVGMEGVPHVQDGRPLVVNVRPEDVVIQKGEPAHAARFKVYTTQPMGSEILVHLKSERGQLELMSKCPEEQGLGLRPEMSLTVRFRRGNFFDAAGGQLLGSFGS
jgi:multiple sugar transport system ATP-binding protein